MVHTPLLKRHLIPVSGIILCILVAIQVLPAQTNSTQTDSTSAKTPGTSTGAKTTSDQPAYDSMEFKGHSRMESLTNTLVGNNFVYQRADSVTTGDHGRYKEDPKTHKGILDADGNLVFDDPKHHATCNKAHIDTTIKLAVFTESVVLILKPEEKTPDKAAAPAPTTGVQTVAATAANAVPTAQPDDTGTNNARGQQKHGATVYCDRMEDEYKKKYIKLFGHVLFKQKFVDASGKTVERELTAEHAEYNGKTESMVLFGPVDGHDSKGQEVHSKNKVTLGTKEGEESLEGDGIKTRFLPQDDAEEADSAPGGDSNAKPATDTKATDAAKDKGDKTSGAKGTR
jgi:hypothetical protein